jgi:GxxExxY protein
MRMNDVTQNVIHAAMNVHTALGAGLLEKAYDPCFCYELAKTGTQFKRQVRLPVKYHNVRIDCAYRVDFLVEDRVIVELKAVERLLPVHRAQVLSYLKLSGMTLGLLINFNVPHLRHGIQRIVNGYRDTD